MKLWMILGLAAPLSIAAPFAIPLLAQDQAATQAAAPEKKKEATPSEAATATEEAELADSRRRRAMINDVVRCPKRPTENQFRTYNLLNDQMIKLKQQRARLEAAERRLADLQRQMLSKNQELLKLQRLLDEKLTDKEVKEAEARAERIRKLVKILEVMQPAGAKTYRDHDGARRVVAPDEAQRRLPFEPGPRPARFENLRGVVIARRGSSRRFLNG